MAKDKYTQARKVFNEFPGVKHLWIDNDGIVFFSAIRPELKEITREDVKQKSRN